MRPSCAMAARAAGRRARGGCSSLACLGLAALSLLGPSQPTYDPWAWLIWGRDIVHLDLVTTAGPSWKPLPVLFTTPFALLGDAPRRSCGSSSRAPAGCSRWPWRTGSRARLGGRAAGVDRAPSRSPGANLFASFATRGNSEGLLVGLALWAVERHLDGRRRDAFLLGVGCALLRPETWPFVALYGVWLVAAHRHDAAARGASSRSSAARAQPSPLLWFVPEYIGSGDFFRAASRALEPVPNSPAQAAHPFLAVFTNSATALSPPAYVGGVAGRAARAVAARARRPRRTVVLALAAAATVLMVTVAVLAEIGFTGNLRYVALPASIVCVLAGVGWAGLSQLVRSPGGRTARRSPRRRSCSLAAAPFALTTVLAHRATSSGRCATRRRRAPTCRPRSRRAGGEARRRALRDGEVRGRSRRSSSPGTCTCTSARSASSPRRRPRSWRCATARSPTRPASAGSPRRGAGSSARPAPSSALCPGGRRALPPAGGVVTASAAGRCAGGRRPLRSDPRNCNRLAGEGSKRLGART